MAIMYSFCFWFSVRLGSIIIGFLSLVQTLIILILLGIGYDNPKDFKLQIKDWLDHNNLLLMGNILSAIKNDTSNFLIILLVIFSLYAVFSILLIVGAFLCNTYIMYPYIGFEFARLISFSFLFIYSMILIKENHFNLGVLIGCCIGGGFLLLYFFYMWACTISLVQIIKILEEEEDYSVPSGSLQPAYAGRPISVIPLGLNNPNTYNILSKLDY